MTKGVSRTRSSITLIIVFCSLCTCFPSAQTIMNCDTFKMNENTIILECSNFFNYFTNEIDSFPKLLGYEMNDSLGIELPLGMNEKIVVFQEKNQAISDTVKVSYMCNQIIFLSGMLVNGLATGRLTGEFYGDSYSAEFQDGQLDGEYKIIYDSGEIYVENYQEGKREGPTYEVNAAGITTRYCNYKNNLPDGPELKIYDDGRLDYYFYHVNGVLEDGIYRRFDGSGNQIELIKVENGKVVFKSED